MGATSGRTTLNGEGLQHQDGHSLLMAHTNPAVRAYDPAFAYVLATIIRSGIDEMYVEEKDVLYYIAVYNENHPMPPKPQGSEEGIIKGAYKLRSAPKGDGPIVRLLGSGPIMLQLLAAVEILETYGMFLVSGDCLVGPRLVIATSRKLQKKTQKPDGIQGFV